MRNFHSLVSRSDTHLIDLRSGFKTNYYLGRSILLRLLEAELGQLTPSETRVLVDFQRWLNKAHRAARVFTRNTDPYRVYDLRSKMRDSISELCFYYANLNTGLASLFILNLTSYGDDELGFSDLD